MRDKYEISLWEDYPDTTNGGIPFLNERKICIIGSDELVTNARAIEPKLINNVNGTNTFTFKMRQTYIDEITGERYRNPFLSLLINERKIKIFWKDKWYDMLIKNIEEDNVGRFINYTCEDLFITELSKNGYNLEFTSDLQNNIGTASDLTEQVLNGSGWQFDRDNSATIIQKTEDAVYEVITQQQFNAIRQYPQGNVVIPANKTILVYYSPIANMTSGTRRVQFLYSADGYSTEENSMLVTNGNCCAATLLVSVDSENSIITFKTQNSTSTDPALFVINQYDGISNNYRAERLVNTYVTEYDKLLDRYVNVYTDSQNNDKKVYGYQTTEFSDPLSVVNLLVNSSNFKNTEGWIITNGTSSESLTFGIYPKFTNETDITTYSGTSWLRVPEGGTQGDLNGRYIYNKAFSSNKQYLTPSQGEIKHGELGGFHIGDRYIFRVKFKYTPSNSAYVKTNAIQPLITPFNSSSNVFAPINVNDNYFSVGERVSSGNWNEYVLTCIKACPADKIDTLGFYIHINISDTSSDHEWIEDVQFFKEEYGVASYENNAVRQRINPGEIDLQSVRKTVYKYYNADHTDSFGNVATNSKDLSFLYVDSTDTSRFIPMQTNFEKYAAIEVKESNRFNILQSIAENFGCWIRFTINHDSNGKILFDENGLPQKYVTLVEYLGKDLGWSFEYGIDLQSIRRSIISNEIATKIIVRANENEFGLNGFCSIARSNLNYTKDNFILNLDYYINQGLLDRTRINKDLYKPADEQDSNDHSIGYFYWLNKYNNEYDEITKLLLQKEIELTKQQSQLIVLENQQKAIEEELNNCKSEIMKLANQTSWANAQTYVRNNSTNDRIQSLINTIGYLTNSSTINNTKITEIKSSISVLEDYIEEKKSRQITLSTYISNLHEQFFVKYSHYIQEGTWQDTNQFNDDQYYLDAVDVAYTSSRPQLQYDINVMRLTTLEEFASKVFDVGDICYIQDREYFGYGIDGITPQKLKIIISEITSYFDEPEKDSIKVQNYKTQFDDLFQRITATTQSLQYSQSGFERAAETIKPDKTLSFDLLQDTFDYNENFIMNASNQQVIWDSTGITVTDNNNATQKLRLMAGGLFISNDGGITWKNAVRGDGISADTLTAGRINTTEIYVYDGAYPSFRWDGTGVNAYFTDNNGTNFNKFVRFDRFGLYGYSGNTDFVPLTEDSIWSEDGVKFGLTWKGFFLKGSSGGSSLTIADDGTGITFSMKSQTGNSSLEISTTNDIVLKSNGKTRVRIGRNDPTSQNPAYGLWLNDSNENPIFSVGTSNTIGGWTVTQDSIYYKSSGTNRSVGLYAGGKTATIQGDSTSHDFLILSQWNNDYIFGVDTYGRIYGASGKIGGWDINPQNLKSGNITISSTGSINCIATSAEVETILPKKKAETIYIVGKNYCKISGQSDPTFDYALVIPDGGPSEETVRGWLESATTPINYTKTAIANTNNFNIKWTCSARQRISGGVTYKYDYSKCNGTLYVSDTSTFWKITSTGEAVFNNVQANGGTIAGWHITPDSIYLTDEDGNIRTSLNSGWDATYNVSRYTIITNSISAGGGSIGGWGIGASNINSGGIVLDSSVPSITIGGATLTGASGGLNMSGALAVSGTFSANGGNTFLGNGTLRLGNTTLDETNLSKLISIANNYSTHIHYYLDGTTQKHTGYPSN